MAFPTVAATATSINNDVVTSHSAALPASIAADDLLLVFFQCDGNLATASTPSGWNSIFNNGQTAARLMVLWRQASGSEGATLGVTTSAGTRTRHSSYRISAGTWQGTPELSSSIAGTNNPPALSPSWGSADTLWIAQLTLGDDAAAISGAPTNYTDLLSTGIGNGFHIHASARRENATSSEDPGAFSSTGTEARTVVTIGIRPAAAAVASRKSNLLRSHHTTSRLLRSPLIR